MKQIGGQKLSQLVDKGRIDGDRIVQQSDELSQIWKVCDDRAARMERIETKHDSGKLFGIASVNVLFYSVGEWGYDWRKW